MSLIPSPLTCSTIKPPAFIIQAAMKPSIRSGGQRLQQHTLINSTTVLPTAFSSFSCNVIHFTLSALKILTVIVATCSNACHHSEGELA